MITRYRFQALSSVVKILLLGFQELRHKCAMHVNHALELWQDTDTMRCAQVHAAIRENPAAEKTERKKPSETKNWKPKKLTYDERKQKLKVCCCSATAVSNATVELCGMRSFVM